MARIADLLFARKANKRIRKLSKRLQKDPTNRDMKAELWLWCKNWEGHVNVFGPNMPDPALVDHWKYVSTLARTIEAELGLVEIADCIEHLDPMHARSLRDNTAPSN